jgi:hypothetical protein
MLENFRDRMLGKGCNEKEKKNILSGLIHFFINIKKLKDQT